MTHAIVLIEADRAAPGAPRRRAGRHRGRRRGVLGDRRVGLRGHPAPARATSSSRRSSPGGSPSSAASPGRRRWSRSRPSRATTSRRSSRSGSDGSTRLRRVSARSKRRPSRRRCSSATAARPAAPSRARSGGSASRRSIAAPARRRSPAATTSPVSPSRTSPPATAPTASLARTGRPWCIASLHDQPPRLAEPRRRHRGQHGQRGRRVGDRQLGAGDGTEQADALASAAGAASGPSPMSTSVASAPDGAPGLEQHVDRPSRARAGRRRARAGPSPSWCGRGTRLARRRRPPRANSSGSTDCGATNTSSSRPRIPAHEPAHVLAVGDHGVGVAVDAVRHRPREQVGGRARLRPHRGPQHERPPPAAARPRRRPAASPRRRTGRSRRRSPAGGERLARPVDPPGRERRRARAGRRDRRTTAARSARRRRCTAPRRRASRPAARTAACGSRRDRS